MDLQSTLKNSSQGMGFLGDILGGVGSYLAAKEEQGAYNYNAQIFDTQASEVMTASDFQIRDIEGQEGFMLDTQKAQYAKAGVTMNGSPTDVAVATATNFEFDKLVTTYNSKVQAQELQSKADMERYYGKVAVNRGKFQLGMSLLKGGMDLFPTPAPKG